MLTDCAAAIIAGGRGTRLDGVNKALLEIGGRPLLDRQLEVLGRLFPEILLVANDPAPFAPWSLRVVPDELPDRGAPGGVHAALAAARASWVFCIGCDMPWPSERAIAVLADLRAQADAVAPVRAGRLEPLFAFYARACRPAFDRCLREGSPSFREVLADVRLRTVPEETLAAVDPGLRSLVGINTPEDLARES